MTEAFEAATEKALASIEGNSSSSPESNTQSAQTDSAPTLDTQEAAPSKDEVQAILDLEKVGKFKFGGNEYTINDLQKAMLRQADYTKKTQSLAEERRSFQREQQFYENLYLDLESVKNDPSLAEEFIKVYPEKFHGYLQRVLQSAPMQTDRSEAREVARPTMDVNLMSRLNKLEKAFTDQEVQKAKLEINQTIDSFSKKYPDALPELVLARAYEMSQAGTKITSEVWEDLFKGSDKQMKEKLTSSYGKLQKQQLDANNKAKDVESGGGTVGRAPKKMSFKEATEAAVAHFGNRG